jgi:hypothetical protein
MENPKQRGSQSLPGRAQGSYAPCMLRWITGRSRHFWLSVGIGVLTAVVALPSFTDPWPADAGGVVFVSTVAAALVRGAVALGHAFLEGWREPPGRAAG